MSTPELIDLQPGYAMVPAWILRGGFSSRSVHLYGLLKDYARQGGEAFPGRERLRHDLADEGGPVSLATVDRAVRELVRRGALQVTRRGLGQTNLYALAWEAPESSPVTTLDPSPVTTPETAPVTTADAAPVTTPNRKNTQEETQVTPPPPADAVGVEEVEGEIVEEGDTPDPEHQRLAVLLADVVEANGAQRPGTGKRAVDVIRLMVERDGRTLAQIEAAIRWSAQDEFWRSVVLSTKKLRQHYDAMALRARASGRRESAHEKAQRERRARIARLEVA